MDTVDLKGLLGYLQTALDTKNRLWLAAHLMRSKEEDVTPYTREELIARVKNAENEIASGQCFTEEEVDKEIDAMLNDLEVAEAA
jgi:predicted transcriptional regulator